MLLAQLATSLEFLYLQFINKDFLLLQNLSQLASINHDLLLQTGRDSAKHSPSRAPNT